MHIKTKYINGECSIHRGQYRNGGTFLEIVSESGEPEAMATVWLPAPLAPGCVWLKGWSENEGIPQALADAGVVRLTGRKTPTGFCEAEEGELL